MNLQEKIFRKLLENSSISKKILLLVHPDIVFETNFSFAQLYYKELEYNMTRFDCVITHLFYSDKAYEYLKWDYGTTLLYHNFIKMLKQQSDFIEKDQNYSISFDKFLADYLIENQGSTVYFAGGYEALCVEETKKALNTKFGWLLKETNTQIACYPELTVSSRHNPKIG